VIESGQQKLNILERYTPLNGEAGWVKTDKIPWFSAGSKQRGVLVVAQDVSELKQAEDKLRVSEQRFQLVSRATQDGIWDWPDTSNDYVYCSPQCKSMLGLGETESEGSAKKFKAMLHPDDLSLIKKTVNNLLSDNPQFDLECRMAVNPNEYKWFRAKGLTITNETTQSIRIIGSIADIQQQKDSEAKVQRYTAELERSNQELDTFAYVASHDLKAPLRGVTQLATWISEDFASGEVGEIHEKLQLMRSRIQRMDVLLSDLLAYSRVGRQTQSVSMVSIAVLAQGAFDLVSPPPGFKLELKNDLPVFRSFVTPLDQIFRNLVGNAVKHYGDDNGVISIGCEPADKPDYYRFSVRDQGQGIEAKYHEMIFDMFKSLRPRDEVEGSGMGLALVKKIIETYKGELWLESSPGEGSCFYFTWPISVAA